MEKDVSLVLMEKEVPYKVKVGDSALPLLLDE